MYERLTHKNKYGRWVVDFHGLDGRVIKELHGVEIERLAAYEDSGLSPEDCTAYAKGEAEKRIVVFENYEHLREIRELMQAKAEGRLVVLPCKVGDTVFFTRWSLKSGSREIYAKTVINVRYDSCDRTVMISDGEKYGMLDRDVFLTREAAEKALGGGEDAD